MSTTTGEHYNNELGMAKIRRALSWLIFVVVECALVWLAYDHSFIIKWPPQGPIRYFMGWGTVAILFIIASAAFWSLVGLARLFWSSRRERNRLSIIHR